MQGPGAKAILVCSSKEVGHLFALGIQQHISHLRMSRNTISDMVLNEAAPFADLAELSAGGQLPPAASDGSVLALAAPRPKETSEVTCTDLQLALIDFAAERLKAAGFVFVCASMKPESCYYRLGDRQGVLRVSGHRFGKRSEGSTLPFTVWSSLTFQAHQIKSVEAVLAIIHAAVGRYFMYPLTSMSDARAALGETANMLQLKPPKIMESAKLHRGSGT